MKFPYQGAGIGLIHNNSILIGRRADVPFFGKWSVPGGTREKGESDKECAFREFKEETGVELDENNLTYIGSWSLKFPFFSWKTYFYSTVTQDFEFHLSEFSDLKWVKFKDLKNYKMRPFSKFELKILSAI